MAKAHVVQMDTGGKSIPAEAAPSLTCLKQKWEFSKSSEEAGVEKRGEGEGNRRWRCEADARARPSGQREQQDLYS